MKNCSLVEACILVDPVIDCGPVHNCIFVMFGFSITVLERSKGMSTSLGLLKIKYNLSDAPVVSSPYYLSAASIVPITLDVSPPSVTEMTTSPFLT